ncbi:MAG: hypothetical protein MJA27_30240 [Pseudanabaenales cyanobacterium]|nr:hypothetical protein [Pseudanabaenales cyanobacterium]
MPQRYLVQSSPADYLPLTKECKEVVWPCAIALQLQILSCPIDSSGCDRPFTEIIATFPEKSMSNCQEAKTVNLEL